MTALLISDRCNSKFGAAFRQHAKQTGFDLDLLVLPADPEARIADDSAARARIAYFSGDLFPRYSKQFFSATRKAGGLEWLHVFNAGIDHPIYATILERGVRLTTSSGSTAEPIAQTAIAGLLYFARNFARWMEGQRARKWDPMPLAEFPRDLRGQVVIIYGMGKIGSEIARLARLLGLHVIGVRRTATQSEHANEMCTPAQLDTVLPRCDWLVITCPLSEQTRGMVDADLLARLPSTAHIINVGRGEIVDEAALIVALQSGKLAGAYLDVFAQEPLPVDSPLWTLPNVIITPHNSAASTGNEARVNAIFLDNLQRWYRREPLINEVTAF